MMKNDRYLRKPLSSSRSRGKTRLVLGARQTGKSTLFELIRSSKDVLFDLRYRSWRPRLARDSGSAARPQQLTPRVRALPWYQL
ncbi:MAG: hypothetical protein D6806_02270 [Deltaproteobacteria bacterium]|nr:MAG: hypothetical protein D6806_02270 [Deltaproteobacteria bacterium]